MNFESCAHCVVFLTLPLQDKAFVTYITSAELGAANTQWLDEGIYMHAPLPPASCTHTYIYSVYLTGEGGGCLALTHHTKERARAATMSQADYDAAAKGDCTCCFGQCAVYNVMYSTHAG